MPEVTLNIDLLPELWQLVADWINTKYDGEPNTLEICSVAGTLLHVAASTWRTFAPPPEMGDGFKFDEEAFVAMARQMFQKAHHPGESSAAPFPTPVPKPADN